MGLRGNSFLWIFGRPYILGVILLLGVKCFLVLSSRLESLIWRLGWRFEVFSSSGAQLQGKKCSICSREARSPFPPITGFVAKVIAPFCSLYFKVSLIIWFLVAWPNFLRRAQLSLRRLRDLKEDSRVLTLACSHPSTWHLIYILTVFWSYLEVID